jgi:histidinol-phosphatase (PHP family)
MSLNIDLHLHSNHSCDAHASVAAMCLSAINKGFQLICFTEHFDLDPRDPGYNFYNHAKYSKDLAQARETFAGRLTILQGIEFGEPHLYPKEFERMLQQDFDFVLGSVHWLGDSWAGDPNFQARYSLENIFEIHYAEVLRAVQFGGFDALAHIDFPKRYLLKTHEPAGLLDEILKELVKQGIALELNSSPVRKGYSDIFPSDSIIEQYLKQGGTKVTIGSDAHAPDDIGRDFDKVADKVRNYRLQPVYFLRRQAVAIPPRG